jgi:hypothetical protein
MHSQDIIHGDLKGVGVLTPHLLPTLTYAALRLIS